MRSAFYKIDTGYEATTTTVNSSCLMYGYNFAAILITKVTCAQGAIRTNGETY